MDRPYRGSVNATSGVGPHGTSGRPGLQWYADSWPRRSRQLLLDACVAGWCLGWVALGLVIGRLVAATAGPVRSAADNTSAIAGRLRETGDELSGIPLLGEQASAPLDAAAGATSQLAESADRLVTITDTLAVALGVVVPLAPIGIALALWLPARLGYARRAAAARRLLLAGSDPSLFALRALANRPLPQLLAVSPDPAADWRRGDPATITALAHLELTALGLTPQTPDPPGIRP